MLNSICFYALHIQHIRCFFLKRNYLSGFLLESDFFRGTLRQAAAELGNVTDMAQICHRYGRYGCVEILEGWGKTNVKVSSAGVRFVQGYTQAGSGDKN